MIRQAVVVEDDPVAGSLVVRTLRSCGLQTTSLGAESALAWARSQRPLLVVAGRWPARGTTDLARALKLDRATCPIPVIRLTATPERPRRLEIECEGQLARPVREDELRLAVQGAQARAAERERTGVQGEVHFRLPSDLAFLEELNAELGTLLRSAGLSLFQVQKLTLAVRELVANAIEWGHGRRPDLLVRVICRFEPDRVTVAVRDSGPGFDPRDLPHAAKEADPVAHLAVRAALNLREGGFGILMANGLVDELRYNETGNEGRLVLYLAAARRRCGSAVAGTPC
jgi:anti-sigma regulatory factor (Ser/Thr protein kinase)/CheY-like chemotaxis protein